MKCWEETGCSGDMAIECPHDAAGVCPRTCINTINCPKSQHEKASGMEIFESPDVDFSAARKENCHSCRFFLKNAPRISKSKTSDLFIAS